MPSTMSSGVDAPVTWVAAHCSVTVTIEDTSVTASLAARCGSTWPASPPAVPVQNVCSTW